MLMFRKVQSQRFSPFGTVVHNVEIHLSKTLLEKKTCLPLNKRNLVSSPLRRSLKKLFFQRKTGYSIVEFFGTDECKWFFSSL